MTHLSTDSILPILGPTLQGSLLTLLPGHFHGCPLLFQAPQLMKCSLFFWVVTHPQPCWTSLSSLHSRMGSSQTSLVSVLPCLHMALRAGGKSLGHFLRTWDSLPFYPSQPQNPFQLYICIFINGHPELMHNYRSAYWTLSQISTSDFPEKDYHRFSKYIS